MRCGRGRKLLLLQSQQKGHWHSGISTCRLCPLGFTLHTFCTSAWGINTSTFSFAALFTAMPTCRVFGASSGTSLVSAASAAGSISFAFSSSSFSFAAFSASSAFAFSWLSFVLSEDYLATISTIPVWCSGHFANTRVTLAFAGKAENSPSPSFLIHPSCSCSWPHKFMSQAFSGLTLPSRAFLSLNMVLRMVLFLHQRLHPQGSNLATCGDEPFRLNLLCINRLSCPTLLGRAIGMPLKLLLPCHLSWPFSLFYRFSHFSHLSPDKYLWHTISWTFLDTWSFYELLPFLVPQGLGGTWRNSSFGMSRPLRNLSQNTRWQGALKAPSSLCPSAASETRLQRATFLWYSECPFLYLALLETNTWTKQSTSYQNSSGIHTYIYI